MGAHSRLVNPLQRHPSRLRAPGQDLQIERQSNARARDTRHHAVLSPTQKQHVIPVDHGPIMVAALAGAASADLAGGSDPKLVIPQDIEQGSVGGHVQNFTGRGDARVEGRGFVFLIKRCREPLDMDPVGRPAACVGRRLIAILPRAEDQPDAPCEP